ncbi:hypothetical protein IWX47DRAFT_560879 [Phyllosticta citricarpa]
MPGCLNASVSTSSSIYLLQYSCRAAPCQINPDGRRRPSGKRSLLLSCASPSRRRPSVLSGATPVSPVYFASRGCVSAESICKQRHIIWEQRAWKICKTPRPKTTVGRRLRTSSSAQTKPSQPTPDKPPPLPCPPHIQFPSRYPRVRRLPLPTVGHPNTRHPSAIYIARSEAPPPREYRNPRVL